MYMVRLFRRAQPPPFPPFMHAAPSLVPSFSCTSSVIYGAVLIDAQPVGHEPGQHGVYTGTSRPHSLLLPALLAPNLTPAVQRRDGKTCNE